MNNFESNLRYDTILSTGLLAIAIAWVALAAIQGTTTPASSAPIVTSTAPASMVGAAPAATAHHGASTVS